MIFSLELSISNLQICIPILFHRIYGYAHKFAWAGRTFSDCIAVLRVSVVNHLYHILASKHIDFQAYEHWNDKVNTGFFRTLEDEKRWCWNQYLQPKNLREMKMTIEEIWQSLERFNIRRFQLPNRVDRSNFNIKDDNYLVLKICIFGAFFPNYFGKLKSVSSLKYVT